MAKQIKIVILISLIISAIVMIFVYVSTSKPQPKTVSPTPKPGVSIVHAAEITSVGSPDGKFTLTMSQTNVNDSIKYTFSVTDEVARTQKEIYSKTVPSGTTISIPANTFSSDNKYIFFKEVGSSGVGYFVILKDSQTLDVSNLFSGKYQDYVITDVTGWAGPTLLVVNTDKATGGIGSSIWFDAASKSFIQLSTRFN